MVFNFKKSSLVSSMTLLWGGTPASVAMDVAPADKAVSPKRLLYKEMLGYDKVVRCYTNVLNRSYADGYYL